MTQHPARIMHPHTGVQAHGVCVSEAGCTDIYIRNPYRAGRPVDRYLFFALFMLFPSYEGNGLHSGGLAPVRLH